MAIDSHMHINSLVLKDLKKAILNINNNMYLKNVINIGLNIKTSKESIDIAKYNKKFYSSVGIHPLYIDSENCDEVLEIANNEKVVAIGEIGLDSNHDNIELQKIYLIKQILIANELKLPVIIHSNNMNKEVIEIFEKYAKPQYGCVFHCFQPNIEDLQYLINNNFYISFAGRITYKTAKKSHEIANLVPDNLFMVETDSPYIAPFPYSKDCINESSNINLIINKLATIKNTTYKKIENITETNTKQLFKKIK